MTSVTKAVLVAGAMALLSACGIQHDIAKNMQPEGAAFDRMLFKGYLDLAAAELKDGDATDSDYFAERAMRAGKPSRVEPEEVKNRRIPADKVGELNTARERLVKGLNGGGRERAPVAAAAAQWNFDCWLEQQEENFQPADIEKCKKGFETAIAEVEKALAPAPAAAAAAPAAPAAAAFPGPFQVHFEFASTKMKGYSGPVLDAVAKAVKDGNVPRVMLSGHTDRSGDPQRNARLSLARAQAVADALKAKGVPDAVIKVDAFGESTPPVATADGAKEQRNRVVVIRLSR